MKLIPISHEIWDMKYRWRLGAPGDEHARVKDRTVEDTWTRVAAALAAPERSEREAWALRFYEAMADFGFLPAGRILAGAGTERSVTLFNCFVMGTIPDDLGSIFEHLREAALTMQQGGGIGYDFSTLRPRGAPVAGVGADASGPVSFMDVWDSMCRTIMSAGSRRGAMMATLACDHPDIEEFIEAKRDPARLRMFNLSVLVSDAFMEAVREDRDWALRFGGAAVKTIKARALWDKIMQATYDYAEPGVIFIDRINEMNNLHYAEHISATNPCGEQPLPPYGACLLGSINLARFVRNPFEDGAHLDEAALTERVRLAVRMMDNVVDISRYPLEAQAQEARAKRRIGLGVTGLADALILCRARYGGPAALALSERWLGLIQRTAYLASTELAAEKGAFPLFDREGFLSGKTVRGLDPDVREAIAEHGVRNALLTSIAPTGTISLFSQNVSSGIEPVFSFTYKRRVTLPDGGHAEHRVDDYAYRLFREKYGAEAPLPDYFVSAQTIAPSDHVAMQAAAQKYVDSSISKTINVPEDTSFEAFKDVYRLAYDTGCKGCTTYRPNDITGSVLSVDTPRPASDADLSGADTGADTGAPEQDPVPEQGPLAARTASVPEPEAASRLSEREVPDLDGVVFLAKPMERPVFLGGRTYKLSWPESDHAIYITINDIEHEGRRRPFEIFINSKNMEHYAWTVALTRMISAVFRRGGDVAFVVEELKAVFDPRGGHWMKGRYVPSLLAAIGEAIEEHMIAIGFLKPEDTPFTEDQAENAVRTEALGGRILPVQEGGRLPGARGCPRCGQPAMIRVENCDTCQNCGYSKCS